MSNLEVVKKQKRIIKDDRKIKQEVQGGYLIIWE